MCEVKRNLSERIKHPDFWHLPACYWFWQHVPSPGEIDAKLKDLKAVGFGSFQIATRLATPIDDYLSDRFLNACRYCADIARELKLMMGIYDDYNWQSGHAGGLCVKLDPAVKERHLFWCIKNIDIHDVYTELKISSISSGDAQCLFDIGKNWIYEGGKALWDEWEIIGVYNFTADGKNLAILDKTQFEFYQDELGVKIRVKTDLLPYTNLESKLALFAAARCKSSRMVNYLLPKTAQAFIKTTYEPYAKALGEHLGTTVRYTFFDQPHSCFYQWQENTSQVRSSLMFSKEFLDLLATDGELGKAHCLISLLGDYFPDSASKRCFVFETYAHLSFKNYFEPLRKWCREHNLLFSGHEVLGHVHSWNFADTVITEDNRCNFALDYFALDALRDITAVDAKNSISQISAKMGDSVARANGRSGCILEQYYGREEKGSHFGAGFWELKPLDLYAQVMRHHILGMRQFLMHAFYLDDGSLDNDEIFKNPRLDFAPGINFEPWYQPFFTKICHDSAIVSEFLDAGDPVFDLAIFYPRRNFYVSGMKQEYGRICADLAKYLSTHAYDYLFLDEDYLDKAQVKDGKLILGKESFNALLLPDVKVVKTVKTLKLIQEFAKAGLKIFVIGSLPSFAAYGENDEAAEVAKSLISDFFVRQIDFALEELNEVYAPKLEKALSPLKEERLRLEFAPRKDPVWSKLLKTKDGYAFCVFNDSHDPLALNIVGEKRSQLVKLDFESTEFEYAKCKQCAHAVFLHPYEMACFILSDFDKEIYRTLKDGWLVTADGHDCCPVSVECGLEEQGFENFAGKALYQITFSLESSCQKAMLLLPKCHDGVKVYLNKGLVGKSLGQDYCFSLDKGLKQGSNLLEIEVYTSAANYYYQRSKWRKGGMDNCGLLSPPILKLIM